MNTEHKNIIRFIVLFFLVLSRSVFASTALGLCKENFTRLSLKNSSKKIKTIDTKREVAANILNTSRPYSDKPFELQKIFKSLITEAGSQKNEKKVSVLQRKILQRSQTSGRDELEKLSSSLSDKIDYLRLMVHLEGKETQEIEVMKQNFIKRLPRDSSKWPDEAYVALNEIETILNEKKKGLDKETFQITRLNERRRSIVDMLERKHMDSFREWSAMVVEMEDGTFKTFRYTSREQFEIKGATHFALLKKIVTEKIDPQEIKKIYKLHVHPGWLEGSSFASEPDLMQKELTLSRLSELLGNKFNKNIVEFIILPTPKNKNDPLLFVSY